MKVLADDIGGTNARLMIAEVEAEGCKVCFSHTLPSEEHPYFAAALTDFLEMAGNAAAGWGCLFCAGGCGAGPLDHHLAIRSNE